MRRNNAFAVSVSDNRIDRRHTLHEFFQRRVLPDEQDRFEDRVGSFEQLPPGSQRRRDLGLIRGTGRVSSPTRCATDFTRQVAIDFSRASKVQNALGVSVRDLFHLLRAQQLSPEELHCRDVRFIGPID
jgi:hypothetical protein